MKKFLSKVTWVYWLFFALFILVGISLIVYQNQDRYISNDIAKVDTVYVDRYLAHTDELNLVKKDLITYNKFSNNVINDMVSNIDIVSKKYSMPVGLLHAIFRIESEYRFWIEHPSIKVKGKTTHAIGLGGVVWEYWSDSLKSHSIAEKRSDLFIYDVNIEATAAILRWLTNDILKKDSTINTNIVNKLIKRYYGAYNKDYYNKIKKVTSDLWIKRINKILIK